MDQVFITGMYRSGTTLLHHLLDGHRDLDVFPVENCIIRDMLFFKKLPHQKKRSLVSLAMMIKYGQLDQAIRLMMEHDKLGLPLTEHLGLVGSTGNQVVRQIFDRETFIEQLRPELMVLKNERIHIIASNLHIAYHKAFSAASPASGSKKKNIYVNKCPEAGYSVEFLLRASQGFKVIHVVRDPREVMASFKAKMPRSMFFSPFQMLQRLRIMSHSLECFKKFKGNCRFLLVKYEDLVSDPEKTMKKLSEFLEIEMSTVLLQPTISGELWLGNSSRSEIGHSSGINNTNLSNYKKTLNKLEILAVEHYVRDYIADFSSNDAIKTPRIFSKFCVFMYFFVAIIHIPSWLFRTTRLISRTL